MFKKSKVILLGLSLLSSMNNEAAASQFAQSAWNFVATPSILVGSLASYYIYKAKNDYAKSNFNEKKQQAIAQSANPEMAQKQLAILNFCKEQGIEFTYALYDKDDTWMQGASILTQNGENLITFNDSFFTNEFSELTAEQAFIIGHENVHAIHNDEYSRSITEALVPMAMSITWRLAQLNGRGKTLSTLAALTAFAFSIKANLAYRRYQESRADREASLDPQILQGGIDWFRKSETNIQEKYTETKEKLSSTNPGMIDMINRTEHMLPTTHPSLPDRITALKNQIKKIETE